MSKITYTRRIIDEDGKIKFITETKDILHKFIDCLDKECFLVEGSGRKLFHIVSEVDESMVEKLGKYSTLCHEGSIGILEDCILSLLENKEGVNNEF